MPEAISGVYLIKNTSNGMTYVGQSKDVERRIRQHFHDKRNPKQFIDYAIRAGKKDFQWEILEACPIEDLDYLEEYYIYYFDSINKGYNRSYGENSSAPVYKTNGASRSKYTDEEIMTIRKEYVKKTMRELYKEYGYKDANYNSFCSTINNTHLHLPCYKKTLKQWIYPSNWQGDKIDLPQMTASKVSEEIIMKARRLYVNHSCAEILQMPEGQAFPDRDALDRCLMGKTERWLPYYNKKEQCWIYPENYMGEKETEDQVFSKDVEEFFYNAVANNTKYTNYQAISIRFYSSRSMSTHDIQEKMKPTIISREVINNIINNRTYLHLPYLIGDEWFFPKTMTEAQIKFFPTVIQKIDDTLDEDDK